LACPITNGNLFGLCADTQGNLYVADPDHNAVQKITPAGVVSKYDVTAFVSPTAMTFDGQGNFYVAENDLFGRFNRIRKITPTGMVTTIAGSEPGYADGDGVSAKFKGISDIVVDAQGTIYVSDATNYRVRKLTLEED
jgi:sugar lactone lactonase YvrE